MSDIVTIYWDLETLPDPRQVYKRLPSIGQWPGRTFKGELHSIISFGYRINDEPSQCINVWDGQGDDYDRSNDSALVFQAYEILSQADEIVTHNGKRFDVKVMNTRLARYGMPPLPNTKHVDTKVVAKNGLSLYSNSLADVAKFFGVSDKMHWESKWDTWVRFAFGQDTRADRKIMDKYCKQDVDTMAEVYDKLKPYMRGSAANRGVFKPGEVTCPTCGSEKVFANGRRTTTTQVQQRFMCGDCGSSSFKTIRGKSLKAM